MKNDTDHWEQEEILIFRENPFAEFQNSTLLGKFIRSVFNGFELNSDSEDMLEEIMGIDIEEELKNIENEDNFQEARDEYIDNSRYSLENNSFHGTDDEK